MERVRSARGNAGRGTCCTRVIILHLAPPRSAMLAGHFEFTPVSDGRSSRRVCRPGEGNSKVAGILLSKLLDGHLACFVRSEGELFIVRVNGQERTISRDAWRLLPEQQVQTRDRVHHINHRSGYRGRD
jgi:hypothetical protein